MLRQRGRAGQPSGEVYGLGKSYGLRCAGNTLVAYAVIGTEYDYAAFFRFVMYFSGHSGNAN